MTRFVFNVAGSFMGMIGKALNGTGSRAYKVRISAAHDQVLRTANPELLRRLGSTDGNARASDPSRRNVSEASAQALADGLVVADGATASLYLAALESVLAESDTGGPDPRR